MTAPPAAILGTSASTKGLGNGMTRIYIDVDDNDIDRKELKALRRAGTKVGLALLNHLYSEQATALKLSGFFRMPIVWQCVGTDGHYCAWLRLQKSAYSKKFSEYVDGEGRCVVAHVRRVGNGSGTSEKPPFSAIPLTNEEHQAQHTNGELSLKPREWWDQKRIQYLEAWCWTQLRETLGYESWADVPPEALRDWAEKHQVAKYLPTAYRA